MALWAILSVAMSSVSRWLSGPSCLLQCHLSPGGSLGHLACYTLTCTSVALWAIVSTASSLSATHSCVPRWLSGPSCLLQCHLSLGGSLAHDVRNHTKMKNNNIEVALWAILFLTMSSVSRWLSGPSCFLQCHLSLGGSLGHLVCCNVICL